MTRILPVGLGDRAYDVLVGPGLIDRAGDHIAPLLRNRRTAIVTDSNVGEHHGERLAAALEHAGVAVDVITVPAGEESKSFEGLASLSDQLLALELDRGDVIVAFGGGVVGDLAGFAAAIYKRGIDFVQIPTTLLAQVDSSVGGKVGVNLPAAKNMVGAFLQPIGVLIDTATLDTLDDREYRSGLAEVVKYGVILDGEFFAYLEANQAGLVERDHAVLRRVIARCCRLKADIVEQDEREETGVRTVLNYGHTFAHAYEALSGYGELLHGEAVAMGMLCASRLAERLGRVDAEFTARQERLLAGLGLPTEMPDLKAGQVLRTMMHDKKVEHGRLRFVLPVGMGKVELVADVDPDEVRAVLERE